MPRIRVPCVEFWQECAGEEMMGMCGLGGGGELHVY